MILYPTLTLCLCCKDLDYTEISKYVNHTIDFPVLNAGIIVFWIINLIRLISSCTSYEFLGRFVC